MNSLFWLGIAAGTFTTISLLPQVIKAHQSRHTKDISLLMFVISAGGLTLWFIYGCLTGAVPIILANGITLALTSYLIYLKVRYG
ncbi:MAG TPA: SemiSWEET transporter [Candidatus Sulfotelmatobacter sp.]|nr:SemiSWEET transporter [Candidatus Sulfotelmatobacter sp.]